MAFSKAEQDRIIGLSTKGKSNRQIALTVGRSHTGVSKFLSKVKMGVAQVQKKCLYGEATIGSFVKHLEKLQSQAKMLTTISLVSAHKTWRVKQKPDLKTIRRRVKDRLACRKLSSKIQQAPGDAQERMGFAQENQNRTAKFWDESIWIDNTYLQLCSQLSHISVLSGSKVRFFWTAKGKKAPVKPKALRVNTGKAVTLTGAYYKGKLRVFTTEGKFNSVSAKAMYGKLHKWARSLGAPAKPRLIEDNCRVYKSKCNAEWKGKRFTMLTLPRRSPDIQIFDRALFSKFKAELGKSISALVSRTKKAPTAAKYRRVALGWFAQKASKLTAGAAAQKTSALLRDILAEGGRIVR